MLSRPSLLLPDGYLTIHQGFRQNLGLLWVEFFPVLTEVAQLFIGHIEDILIAELTVKFVQNVIHEGHVILY